MAEILGGVDQHAENQKTFDLPERRIAKIFVFRLIYGGSKWAYALDPDFNWISKKADYWQGVIDKFYEKYRGIHRQHVSWMESAIKDGQLVMPTGRIYRFEPYRNKRGELEWPRTQIYNYPVQGTGHDIVTIARVSLFKRIKNEKSLETVKFLSTVHDSIVLDMPNDPALLKRVVDITNSVFSDIPANFNKLFGVKLNLPIQCEISVGNNLLDTTVVS